MSFLRLCATLVIGVMGWTAVAKAQTPIKIGLLVPLSGNLSALGEHQRRGAELAVEAWNGNVRGRPIQLLARDDQGKPELAVELANRLIQSDKVDFITGAVPSNVVMAVHGPITRSKTFFIGSNGGPAPLAGEKCSEYFFSASWQTDQPAEAMGRFLAGKAKKVYLLAPNYQAGKDALEGFKRGFNGEIIGEVYTSLQQTDFSAELSAVRAAQPDAVFVFYPGAFGVQWVRQYAQAGLARSVPLYSAFTVDQVILPALGDAAVGLYSAVHWNDDFDNPSNKRFVDSYRKKYGATPSAYAAQAYDAVMLIAGAADALKGDLANKEQVRQTLRSLQFSSVRGAFRFNTNHFPVQDFYVVRARKKDGEVGLETVSRAMEQAGDVYAGKCVMPKS